MAKNVSTYIVGWVDDEGNWHSDYIQALDAVQAVDTLGIPEDKVVEVAQVLKDWRRRYAYYTLVDTNGRLTGYKATSAENAIKRAERTFGGTWRVIGECR